MPSIEELEYLKSQEVQVLRDVALKDLWTFATKVLYPCTTTEDATDPSDIHYYAPLHEPICNWVSDTPKCGRKLLLIPREHRKTMLVTVAHAVWRITKDPNIRIILVSALDDTASYFCQMIKRQFQLNEHYLSIFPEMRVGKNQQFGRTHDFTHPLRTNTQLIDPTFRSFYLGAPVAGRRCDILICDDPIEKSHVTTPEQADKALKDFNDLIPIVDSKSKYNMMFVIGTRWAFNDIYGAMLGEYRGADQEAELDRSTAFDSIVRHSFEDDKGNPDFEQGTPILPVVFTRESLLQRLMQYRADPKRGEEDWWKQYMNICIAPSGRKFEDNWFDTWIPRLPQGIVFSFISVDSAAKDEQILMRGDFTVALMCHFDSYGHLYLTDGFRSDRMRGQDIISGLLSMVQRCETATGHRVANFVKEKVGEDTFFGWVRNEFNRARLPLTAIPVTVRGQGKKYVRIIESLQHPTQARQVHFVDNFPKELHRVIVDEATHIGQWSHDDAVDALSLAFHPKVRIRPTTGTSEWRAPTGSRLQQLSTANSVPSALRRANWEREAWHMDAPKPGWNFSRNVRSVQEDDTPGFRRYIYGDRGISKPISSDGKVQK